MDRILIIYPAFAMILLAYFSYIIMILIGKKYVTKKEIKYGQFKLYTGVFPDKYEQSRQHLKNQFELPVIFYLLVALLYSSNNLQYIDIILAWLFVISRYIHSFIRFKNNYLPYRATIFTLGYVILLAGWINFVFINNSTNQEKNIDISIEKIIENDQEVISIIANGSGFVTKEDIDKELEKLYKEKNIDISSDNIKLEIKINK